MFQSKVTSKIDPNPFSYQPNDQNLSFSKESGICVSELENDTDTGTGIVIRTRHSQNRPHTQSSISHGTVSKRIRFQMNFQVGSVESGVRKESNLEEVRFLCRSIQPLLKSCHVENPNIHRNCCRTSLRNQVHMKEIKN